MAVPLQRNMVSMGALPAGYRVSYCRYGPLQPSVPLLLTLSRSDDLVVDDFVLGDLKETMRTIEVAAWRDHREQTLHAVDDEELRP